MYSGSFFDWIKMADEEPSQPNSDAAVLAEVIVTAADMIDTDGVIRLLCDLTDARKAVGVLTEQNARLINSLANAREFLCEETDRLNAKVDDLTVDRDYWKGRANELSDKVTADVQPLLVGDPLVAAARVYKDTRNKITAIKALREMTNLGLREAKLAVEQVIKIVDMKE